MSREIDIATKEVISSITGGDFVLDLDLRIITDKLRKVLEKKLDRKIELPVINK